MPQNGRFEAIAQEILELRKQQGEEFRLQRMILTGALETLQSNQQILQLNQQTIIRLLKEQEAGKG